jgi:hypothetical protein
VDFSAGILERSWSVAGYRTVEGQLMPRLLLALFVLIAPISGWAANTSISNSESGASVRSKLNTQLLQQFNVKQPRTMRQQRIE